MQADEGRRIDEIVPTTLWKRMSDARRLAAAEAFWEDDQSAPQHAQAIESIARRLKFRSRSVANLPPEKKARYLASTPSPGDAIASRALVAYHLKTQRPMMALFLDLLGIGHENGVITDEEVKPPVAERVRAAAKDLVSKYPCEDVALYLSTLYTQDRDAWRALADVPELQARDGS